jgi:hypothetical protein
VALVNNYITFIYLPCSFIHVPSSSIIHPSFIHIPNSFIHHSSIYPIHSSIIHPYTQFIIHPYTQSIHPSFIHILNPFIHHSSIYPIHSSVYPSMLIDHATLTTFSVCISASYLWPIVIVTDSNFSSISLMWQNLIFSVECIVFSRGDISS